MRVSLLAAIQVLLFSIFSCPSTYAWNSQGHELIAQIALMQLTPQEKKKLTLYNQSYQMGYQPRSLPLAAAWLDWLHCNEAWCQSYRYYHYIDYPYSIDGTPSHPPREENALLAIKKARQVLSDPHASPAEKGLQLRVLMHVVGDIHQPLHAISMFSEQFPQGDQGGNRFRLGYNRIAAQLHAYWDRGGGYLVKSKFNHRRLNLKKRGKNLLKHYPCEPFITIDPTAWAQESHQIARNKVYNISFNQKPNPLYHRMVVEVTQQRLALAGCRLSAILKSF